MSQVIEVGGKEYRFSEYERLVGGISGWEVWEFTNRRSGGWFNLKVFDRRPQARRAIRARIFYVGYHPEQGRMARNKDWDRLSAVYPEDAQKLEEVIRQSF